MDWRLTDWLTSGILPADIRSTQSSEIFEGPNPARFGPLSFEALHGRLLLLFRRDNAIRPRGNRVGFAENQHDKAHVAD